MAAEKYNARDCEFEIEDTGTPGTYVAIGGLNTFTLGRDSEDFDTTTYGSGGYAESQIMQRSKNLKLEGFRLVDPTTGVLDPGQAAVEALAEAVGDASLGSFRFAAPGDTTWEIWTANCELGDQGGGNNDKVSWSVTFTRSGPSTTAAKS